MDSGRGTGLLFVGRKRIMDMEHKGTKIIETERLLLRPFQIEDAEFMFRNWASDLGDT